MTPLALFDLDGTLTDRASAYSAAITDLCTAHGYDAQVEQWLLAELADRANPDDFTRLCDIFAPQESPAALWRFYVDRIASSVTCRRAVLDGLAQLRHAGWRVGIATNGASDIQRAKLAATGILDLVDGVAASGDIEVRKPDPRLFELAAARCDTDLTNGGWMIGDNPSGDIGGAQQVGLHTIWLRGRPWPDGLPAAHHVVDDVTDAIAILLNEPWE